jgi:transcriptional regulator with PAS, ATPase and Fis domain
MEQSEHGRASFVDSGLIRLALFERTGQYARGYALAGDLSRHGLGTIQRSKLDYAVGLMKWDDGLLDEAIDHLQRSVLLAKRTDDREHLSWAQLRLWNMFANGRNLEASTSALTEAHRSILKSGDVTTLAAFRIFVGQVDAKRGLLRTATLHTNAGLDLLRNQPNIWLQALAENTRLALAITTCDFDRAFSHGERALQLAFEAGAAITIRACLANYGTLLYDVGRLDEAADYFERALAALPASGENVSGPIDAMACIRLSQGRYADAHELIEKVETSVRQPHDRSLYVFRHATLTRVKYLMRIARWHDAAVVAAGLLKTAQNTGDELLRMATLLAHAEASFHAGWSSDGYRSVIELASELPNLPPDLQGRYEGLLAVSLALDGQFMTAETHMARARRILSKLQCFPALDDLEHSWKSASERAAPPRFRHDDQAIHNVNQTLQAIASLFLYRSRPDIVAEEVSNLLMQSGCADGASLKILSDSRQSNAEDMWITSAGTDCVQIVTDNNRNVRISFNAIADVNASAALSAIRMLLAAAQELERARAERDERLTLWPIEEVPIENEHAVVSGKMRELMAFAQRVAKTPVSVLITGESGTGKEILARAIHAYSPRAKKPFVPFNCTAVPREMLESQLFGHRRGAFTGADRDHPGLIRAAKEGTLFLDEIGELGIDLQPKLLRFLESGEINPLGDATPFTVDVRIIAATNSNLEQLVQEYRFREDLFYRLNVIRLTIPPLRERRDEIPALVHHFVARAATEFAKGRIRLAEETMEHLVMHSWPGNIRQLNNEIRRMVALADLDAVLKPSALSKDITRTPRRLTTFGSTGNGGQELAVSLTEKLAPTLSRIEREMIKVALRAHEGRVEAAAKSLGISRKGLYLKRQRLGL